MPIKLSFPISPFAQSLITANLGLVSVELSILDISYKWNPQYVAFYVWLLVHLA